MKAALRDAARRAKRRAAALSVQAYHNHVPNALAAPYLGGGHAAF